MDPSRSRFGFSGARTAAKFDGAFKRYTVEISFDPAHPQIGHALVVIDMASAGNGNTQRDEAIPGPDWLDVESFPKATFDAKGFQSKGGNSYLSQAPSPSGASATTSRCHSP